MSDYPASADELRQLVSAMRELGVQQAFGVVLGPVPDRADELEGKRISSPESPEVREAIAERRRKAMLDEARAAVRDRLGAVGGYELSDDQVDLYLPPETFQ